MRSLGHRYGAKLVSSTAPTSGAWLLAILPTNICPKDLTRGMRGFFNSLGGPELTTATPSTVRGGTSAR